MTTDEIRRSLARQLMTDKLLGVKSIPIARTRARSATATPAQATAAATVRAAAPSAAVRKLQTISAAELARREKELRAIDEQQVKTCRKCVLCQTRTNTVFGQGSAAARLVFVGEGPGADEDEQGLAFVGRAG